MKCKPQEIYRDIFLHITYATQKVCDIINTIIKNNPAIIETIMIRHFVKGNAIFV
jgi:hypothetical protein